MRLTDVSDLVVLGRARIEGPAEKEFGHDASEGPHVDGLAEGEAEDNFRRSVVPVLKNKCLFIVLVFFNFFLFPRGLVSGKGEVI